MTKEGPVHTYPNSFGTGDFSLVYNYNVIFCPSLLGVLQNFFLTCPCVLDRFGNWKWWLLRRVGNRSSRRKPFGARREPTADSTHIWRQCRDSNPGQIGGRPVLSPLRHPCSPSSTRRSVVITFPSLFFKYVYCSFDYLEAWTKAYKEEPPVSV